MLPGNTFPMAIYMSEMQVTAPDTILASNTSSISITRLAAVTSHPKHVVSIAVPMTCRLCFFSYHVLYNTCVLPHCKRDISILMLPCSPGGNAFHEPSTNHEAC